MGDSVYERDEQLTVEISSSSGKFESKSSTVTIKDDDEGVYCSVCEVAYTTQSWLRAIECTKR